MKYLIKKKIKLKTILVKLGAFCLYSGPLTLRYYNEILYYPLRKTLLINSFRGLALIIHSIKIYQLFLKTDNYILFILDNIKLDNVIMFEKFKGLKNHLFLQRWVKGTLTNRIIAQWSLLKYKVELLPSIPGLIFLGTLSKNSLLILEILKKNIPTMALVNIESKFDKFIDYPIPLQTNIYTLYFLFSIFINLIFLA